MKQDINSYSIDLLWIARFDLHNTERIINPFGAHIAVLGHPLSINCPLNQNGARIISLHSTYVEATKIEDYVQLTLMQTPDYLSLHTPMYPRFYEVLKPLIEKGLTVRAFQFVDVPILRMSLMEVHRKSIFKEQIPFTIRIWV
jgi:hypothetical protein